MNALHLRDDWRKMLSALRPGWDSYGANVITTASLETVGAIAVVPESSGGIQIELHRDGFDIEIYVNSNGRVAGVSLDYNRADGEAE